MADAVPHYGLSLGYTFILYASNLFFHNPERFSGGSGLFYCEWDQIAVKNTMINHGPFLSPVRGLQCQRFAPPGSGWK